MLLPSYVKPGGDLGCDGSAHPLQEEGVPASSQVAYCYVKRPEGGSARPGIRFRILVYLYLACPYLNILVNPG